MENIEKCEYDISVVRAKQYSSTYKHILMINGVPAVIVRGNQSLSDCISYFMNGEPELKDGKIMKILDNIKRVVRMADISNYERIKNMSIEEMSYIFAMVKLNTVKELHPEFELENNMIEEQCENCFNWLNSEVDDG